MNLKQGDKCLLYIHSDDIPNQSDTHPNSFTYYYSNSTKLSFQLCKLLGGQY